MKLIRHFAILVAFAVVGLTSTFAQQVVTDFDHQANFSQYKTYSWQEIKPPNSLWDSRIKNAVDAQLSARGWTSVKTGGDVAAVAIKMTTTQRTLQTFYDNFGGGFGGGWGWRGFGAYRDSFGDATTTEHDYKDGTLVVDLFDAKTKQLIWRGSAEDMLSNKPEKRIWRKAWPKCSRSFPQGLKSADDELTTADNATTPGASLNGTALSHDG